MIEEHTKIQLLQYLQDILYPSIRRSRGLSLVAFIKAVETRYGTQPGQSGRTPAILGQRFYDRYIGHDFILLSCINVTWRWYCFCVNYCFGKSLFRVPHLKRCQRNHYTITQVSVLSVCHSRFSSNLCDNYQMKNSF